jgi:hypothetical protein
MMEEKLDTTADVTAPPIMLTTQETPDTDPAETPVQDSKMAGIETTELFIYVTTLQFHNAHAVASSAGPTMHVGKKVKKWLSTMLLRNPKIFYQNQGWRPA